MNFEQPQFTESKEDRDNRRARGEISENEIREYLKNPDDILFEDVLVDNRNPENKVEMPIKLRALTKNNVEATLANLKDSWDELSFNDLRDTLDKYFEQQESGQPGLLNVEYYIATDEQDQPMGMTGIYSVDIAGGAGLATRDKLDLDKHNLNVGLGWYSVSKKMPVRGLGTYLLNWTENLACSRDASHMEIETDDWENSKIAVALYKKSGYEEGYPVKDHYGPGRDLRAYYCDLSDSDVFQDNEPGTIREEIEDKDKAELLELAKSIYCPEKYEEFSVCLDLYLSNKDKPGILTASSVLLRDQLGKAESFAIYTDSVYENSTNVFWHGAKDNELAYKDKLISSVCRKSKEQDRNVVIINSDSEESDLDKHGFIEAKKGIPGVFEQDDDTRLLLFTKNLKEET